MARCFICNTDFSESLASCPICGFVPDASKLEDADESNDPNVPDLREFWCRKCRGHHGTFLSGVGDDETRECKNCSSDDVHLVWFNITKLKFLWSERYFLFFTFVMFSCFIFSMLFLGHVALSLPFISFFVICVFWGRYRYKTKMAIRNEWIDWAKERGFDENAENK